MKERPILFSGPMVQAILDGHKTQTRRVLKPQPILHDGRWYWPHVPCGPNNSAVRWFDGDSVGDSLSADSAFGEMIARCPYGRVGDRLWVRETWAEIPEGIVYRATDPGWDDNDENPGWRPSIHMPRWASRLTLEITGVRVERVQDISPEDCKAEGIMPDMETHAGQYWREDAVAQFSRLWDMINEKRGFGWNTNPWVWVIEFKVV